MTLSPSIPRRAALTALSLACFAPAAAVAHHGWAEYGADNFVLEGTVREVNLGNPHGLIRITDRDGRVWDAVLAPPSRNRAAGLVDGAIAPGDEVRASGRRHRDARKLEVKSERIEARGRTFDVYPERLSQRPSTPAAGRRASPG